MSSFQGLAVLHFESPHINDIRIISS